MDIILQKLQIMVSNMDTNDMLALLLEQFSDFSPADTALILPIIASVLTSTGFATYALVVILLEIHRRGYVTDGDLVAVDQVGDTVSIAADLVDRTTSIVEESGGYIGGREADIIRNIVHHGQGIRGDLDEIARLTTGSTNDSIADFITIMVDFIDAFETFMNTFNGLG
jgi:hypothetical protein